MNIWKCNTNWGGSSVLGLSRVSYFILSGSGEYNDNGTTRTVKPGDTTWTPSGSGHGLDNSKGTEDIVFMALIVKA